MSGVYLHDGSMGRNSSTDKKVAGRLDARKGGAQAMRVNGQIKWADVGKPITAHGQNLSWEGAMARLLIAIFTAVFGIGGIYAQAATSVALTNNLAGKPAVHEHATPDAMRHLVKGPDVDIKSLRDPFASYLGLMASRNRELMAERQSRLASRGREVLEAFSLATLKLVATMHMGKDRVAMIESVGGKGYIVRRGNYIGKNDGRIEKITDDSLYLVEHVLNPAGDIVKRQVTMTLNEVNP